MNREMKVERCDDKIIQELAAPSNQHKMHKLE
jgi:hypothetical protein